ncbi:MAG: ribonuclease P [Candidatus Aenigmatarchaeota archaeon]|nr:MAG: ribonuclease P [Candidatus Aenigmarchaeota archaeon]
MPQKSKAAEQNRRKKPKWQQTIAKERIEILFDEAAKQAKKKNLDLSNRYVKLARKISMRYQVRIPKHLKRRFCKYCYSYLQPGVTCRQRIKDKIITIKCLSCKRIIRYPIGKR